jgi:hypothetical protein
VVLPVPAVCLDIDICLKVFTRDNYEFLKCNRENISSMSQFRGFIGTSLRVITSKSNSEHNQQDSLFGLHFYTFFELPNITTMR